MLVKVAKLQTATLTYFKKNKMYLNCSLLENFQHMQYNFSTGEPSREKVKLKTKFHFEAH